MPLYHQKPQLGELPDFSLPITDGLVGLWPFNEGTGGIVQDSSNYGNVGTLVGDANWVSSERGRVLDFDTAGYVDTGNIFNELSKLNPYTVVWQSSPDTFGDRLIFGHTIDSGDRLAVAYLQSGTPRVIISRTNDAADGNISATTSSAQVAAAGVWHHFAITNTPGGSLAIFQDGVTAGITGTANINPGSNPLNLHIGSGVSSANRLDGRIADFAVYKQVLSAHGINQLYREGLAAFYSSRYIFGAPGAAPTGAIMNQMQTSNLGADLYNGTLVA